MSKLAALTDLDLSGAYVQDAGVQQLSRALHSNRSLTTLSLAHNGVASTGGNAFADALRVNRTLTRASLCSNLLNDVAAVTLASALAANPVVTEVNLGRNSIGAIGAQALRQALHTNRCLTSLGELNSLPLAVGLRSSIEWYLRANKERMFTLAQEAERATAARDGLLKLLPPEELALRQQIFDLEDHAVHAESRALPTALCD
jgi:hypothetical protein